MTSVAPDASAIARNIVAAQCNKVHLLFTGYLSGIGDQTMRMFETVTSSMLALAVQALVVGVVITTF